MEEDIMANTRLHLANGTYLYYENGSAVKHNGHPVYRWESDNKRWSACGSEVKEFNGKTIFDLEKILWYIFLIKKKIFYLLFLLYISKYDKI